MTIDLTRVDVVYLLVFVDELEPSWDCSPQGVFTTREAAQAAIDAGLGNYAWYFGVDKGAAQLMQGLKPYRVGIKEDNPALDRASVEKLPHFVEGHIYRTPSARLGHKSMWDPEVYVEVWAKDEQDAIVRAREVYGKHFPLGDEGDNG